MRQNAAQARVNAFWYSGEAKKDKRGAYGWYWDKYKRVADAAHKDAGFHMIGAVFCNTVESCALGAVGSFAGPLLGKGFARITKIKAVRKMADRVWRFFHPKCFAAGTLVETIEGLRPIEEIEVGDLVWARDDETGEEDWKPVVRVLVTPNRALLDLDLLEADGDEQELLVTSEHPLWTANGWTTVGKLEIGELVWGRDGWAEVVSVESSGRTETVYNFEVADFHTYFVGEGGIWAHNSCWDDVAEHVAHRFPGKTISQISDYLADLAENGRRFDALNGATIWRRGSEILIQRPGEVGTYFQRTSNKSAKQYVETFLLDNLF